jgi:hypothetical protein
MSRSDAVAAVLDAYKKVLERAPMPVCPGCKYDDGGAYWIKKLMDGSMNAATVRTALSCLAVGRDSPMGGGSSNNPRPYVGVDGLNSAKYRDLLGIQCNDFDRSVLLDRVGELTEEGVLIERLFREVLGDKTVDHITPDGFDYGSWLMTIKWDDYFSCKQYGQNTCGYGNEGKYNADRVALGIACSASAEPHHTNAQAWLNKNGKDCKNFLPAWLQPQPT